MELDKTIQKIRNVKNFKTTTPDWREIIECIDACRYAPMAGNNYTLKFILIQNRETIQKLADATQQHFINQAPYVVVICSNPSRTVNLYEEKGKIYCRQQAGAAIQNLLLKLEQKGLCTYWVRHFVDYIVKNSLNIPQNLEVEGIFPIGFECPKKAKPKRRIELDSIIYFEKYGIKTIKPPKTPDA